MGRSNSAKRIAVKTQQHGERAVHILLALRRWWMRHAWEPGATAAEVIDEAIELLDEIYGPDFDFRSPPDESSTRRTVTPAVRTRDQHAAGF